MACPQGLAENEKGILQPCPVTVICAGNCDSQWYSTALVLYMSNSCLQNPCRVQAIFVCTLGVSTRQEGWSYLSYNQILDITLCSVALSWDCTIWDANHGRDLLEPRLRDPAIAGPSPSTKLCLACTCDLQNRQVAKGET